MSMGRREFIYGALPGLAMVEGRTPFRPLRKFGINPTVMPDSVPETVWTVGGMYPYQDKPFKLEVTSTSEEDRNRGDGARRVVVQGLDENYRTQQATVTLGGTDAKKVPEGRWRRVHQAFVDEGGDSQNAVGNVQICTRNPERSLVPLCVIPPGLNHSAQGVFTVPRGRVCFIYNFQASLLGNGVFVHAGIFTRDLSNPRAVFLLRQEIISGDPAPTFPLRVTELHDVELRVLSVGAETGVVARCDIVLKDG